MNLRKHWPLLASAPLLLVVIATLRPAVPLYDGVGMPDEPYRYVEPLAGRATKNKPAGATETGIAAEGTNKDGIYISTNEQGPQLYISFTQRAFTAPAAASLITVQVTPLAADAAVPPAGRIAGNIYRVTAKSDSGAVTFAVEQTASSYVDLRLPQGYPVGAVMSYRANAAAAWQSLPTEKVGNDIYEAKAVGLGEYALLSRAAPEAPESNKTMFIVFVTAGIAAVVFIVFIVRKQRAKKRAS